MTFQYFFFDTYPGYFVEALPLAVIIAAVYGVIRFRKKRFASEYAVSISELEDCFADNNTPEQEYDAKLLENAVNSFIRSLPDDARKVFIGRYYFFDSVKTVASYCGISEANVKTMLYRTRQKLKDYLVKEEFEL